MSVSIKRKIGIEFRIKPEELARLFLDMPSDEQARVLDHIGIGSAEWCKPATFQWADVAARLDPPGRNFVEDMFNLIPE